MSFLQQLLIVCPLVFFAGLIDSMAGGGGIISLPAYVAAGLPPHLALGSNKFSATWGTLFSTLRFLKKGRVHLKAALLAAAGALVGSAVGSRLALLTSEVYLKVILLVALPILAVFITTNKALDGEKESSFVFTPKTACMSALTGLAIGGYDGFFGPGTGTFLILVFHTLLHFDLLTASGNAKVVNLASNTASLCTFLISGNIVFALAIPAAFAGLAGNMLGSHLALSKGVKAIKPAFVVVLCLLLLKVGFDLYALL